MKKEMKKILVTGAVGQIGSELTMELRRRYGAENVVATGRKTQPSDELRNSGPFHFIDVTRIETVEEIVKKYKELGADENILREIIDAINLWATAIPSP